MGSFKTKFTDPNIISEVEAIGKRVMAQYPEHASLCAARVKIDFTLAYPDYDEKTGEPLNDALKHQGVKALGLARILPLKSRSKGEGDAEILFDGPHWEECGEQEQEALMDHELMHLAVKVKGDGSVATDDLSRPKLSMRKHDLQFGFFNVVAARHGVHSQERIQAKSMMDNFGQAYWPALFETVAPQIHNDGIEQAAQAVRRA